MTTVRGVMDTNKLHSWLSQTDVPTWLETPCASDVAPPAVTRKQELPYGALEWRDFERLCLRLLRNEADIEACRLYGEPGQEQDGIDIFARRKSSTKYTVYQCKRVKEFTTDLLKKAVRRFLDGEWAAKSDSLVICTSHSFNDTKLALELEKQQAELSNQGVKLEPWDCEELDHKLKGCPLLVDDFFGREWARAFCGETAVSKFSGRLDAPALLKLRKSLSDFYEVLFKTQDPGLPALSAFSPQPIPPIERYVIPDVTETRSVVVTRSYDRPPDPLSTPPPGIQEVSSALRPTPEPVPTSTQRAGVSERMTLANWLSGLGVAVLLGPPGCGKTSLLRFIATDVLREEPLVPELAQKWGSSVPVWVSFGYWTSRLCESSGCSLVDLMHDWLKQQDEERLWPLVARALEDERLLLLIDGIDEWTNEEAAEVAVDRLLTFIERRPEISAVATSRPQTFDAYRGRFVNWRVGHIAGFTTEQQRELAHKWFSCCLRASDSPTADPVDVQSRADALTQELLSELTARPDLGELATIPMLLTILIYLKFQNVALPHNRFRAYEELIEHLVTVHPRRRQATASVTRATSAISGRDSKMALAYLAHTMLSAAPSGLLAQAEAERTLTAFFSDTRLGLGMAASEARHASDALVDLATRQLGLVIKRPPATLEFFHRSFLEYMTAMHLSRLDLEEQLAEVRNHWSSPHWHDVFLGLAHVSSRPGDVERIVREILAQRDEAAVPDAYALDNLLAEIAFGEYNCPPALAVELARRAFQQVQAGIWMPQRQRLLQHVMGGLGVASVRPLVEERLRRWFPCRVKWRTGVYGAMATWPKEPSVVDSLFEGIQDEHAHNQLAAGQALATLGKGDEDVGDRLAEIASRHMTPRTRATALWFLSQGWPDHAKLDPLVDAARKSNTPELRLSAIDRMVSLGSQTDAEWRDLIDVARWDSGIDFNWQRQIAQLLVKGWPGSSEIKRKCLDSLSPQGYGSATPSRELALALLLSGYPRDPDVSTYCVQQIQTEKYPFVSAHIDAWVLLSQNFRDDPAIVAAIDEWIPQQEYHDPEMAYAALVGRTDIAKTALFAHLSKSSNPHWAVMALLEGWGMQDGEVAARLLGAAGEPAVRASRIANLLPRIVTDRRRCRTRLLELWRADDCVREDFVALGLQALGGLRTDKDVVDVFFNNVLPRLQRDSLWYDSTVGPVMMACSGDVRLRTLAKEELAAREGCVQGAAAAFGDDEEIRRDVIAVCSPLPTELRESVASYLGTRRFGDNLAGELLGLWDHDCEGRVKIRASMGYHERLRATQMDAGEATNYLAKTIVATGPTMDDRRAAAFCGLLSLNRIDVMRDAREPISPDRPCTLGFATWAHVGGGSPTLEKAIAQNWSRLESAFGTEVWLRLTGSTSEPSSELFDRLSSYAAPGTVLSSRILAYLESQPKRATTAGLLRFLAKTRPRSRVLLDYCYGCLAAGTWPRPTGDALIEAARVIGEQFSQDASVLEKFNEMKLDWEGRIIGLCEAWPQDEELSELHAKVRERNTPLHFVSYFELSSLHGSADELLEALRRWILKAKPFLSEVEREAILRHLVARMRRDSGLVDTMSDRLRTDPAPSEKTTLVRLLRNTNGLSQEFRTWCSEQVTKQVAGTEAPQEGYDLATGTVRPVADVLLDVLHGQ